MLDDVALRPRLKEQETVPFQSLFSSKHSWHLKPVKCVTESSGLNLLIKLISKRSYSTHIGTKIKTFRGKG